MFGKFRILVFGLLFYSFNLYADGNISYYTAYDFEITTLEGRNIKFSQFRDKLLMVVNLPAQCSFNIKYHEFQELWQKYNYKGLAVVAFTSNEFAHKKDAQETIKASYCKLGENLGFYVSTPVNIGDAKLADPFYQWVRQRKGNNAVPNDDYFKILIGTDGEIIDIFSSNVPTLGGVVENKIVNNLPDWR